jgi:hypothetical protein
VVLVCSRINSKEKRKKKKMGMGMSWKCCVVSIERCSSMHVMEMLRCFY